MKDEKKTKDVEEKSSVKELKRNCAMCELRDEIIRFAKNFFWVNNFHQQL